MPWEQVVKQLISLKISIIFLNRFKMAVTKRGERGEKGKLLEKVWKPPKTTQKTKTRWEHTTK